MRAQGFYLSSVLRLTSFSSPPERTRYMNSSLLRVIPTTATPCGRSQASGSELSRLTDDYLIWLIQDWLQSGCESERGQDGLESEWPCEGDQSLYVSGLASCLRQLLLRMRACWWIFLMGQRLLESWLALRVRVAGGAVRVLGLAGCFMGCKYILYLVRYQQRHFLTVSQKARMTFWSCCRLFSSPTFSRLRQIVFSFPSSSSISWCASLSLYSPIFPSSGHTRHFSLYSCHRNRSRSSSLFISTRFSSAAEGAALPRLFLEWLRLEGEGGSSRRQLELGALLVSSLRAMLKEVQTLGFMGLMSSMNLPMYPVRMYCSERVRARVWACLSRSSSMMSLTSAKSEHLLWLLMDLYLCVKPPSRSSRCFRMLPFLSCPSSFPRSSASSSSLRSRISEGARFNFPRDTLSLTLPIGSSWLGILLADLRVGVCSVRMSLLLKLLRTFSCKHGQAALWRGLGRCLGAGEVRSHWDSTQLQPLMNSLCRICCSLSSPISRDNSMHSSTVRRWWF